MADPRLRQITIKSGVLRRLAKEKTVYEREVDQQKARIERLRAEGKDDHVLRKEDEVLQESMMMVPDCHRRLVKAFEDLSDYLKNEDELKETKEFGNALAIIESAREQVQQN